jgi:hypothetical protein
MPTAMETEWLKAKLDTTADIYFFFCNKETKTK